MSTMTVTVSTTRTVTPVIPVTLHVPRVAPINYQWILDDLSNILGREQERHDEQEQIRRCKIPRDYLTGRIYHWVNAGLGIVNILNSENEQEINSAVHARIDELREIIINPLDESDFEEPGPVIDPNSDWSWSLWMYRECRVLFSARSPLDGSTMSENPPPNLFAREMIDFVKRILQSVPSPQATQATQAATTTTASTTGPSTGAAARVSGAVVLSSVSGIVVIPPKVKLNQRQMLVLSRYPQFDEHRRFVYRRCCEAAWFQRNNQEFRQNTENTLVHVEQRMTEIRELSAQAIHDAREEARIAEETIRNRLTQIDETHRNTITGLQGQITSQEQSHQERVRGLETQIASMGQAQSATANLLRQEVAAAQDANRNAVRALHNQIGALNQTHTSDALRLQNQLDQARRDHEAAVSAAAQERQRVTTLGGQLQTAQAHLQTTSQALAASQTQNAQNAAQIQSLNQQIAATNQQLQQIVNSGGGGGGGRRHCVVS